MHIAIIGNGISGITAARFIRKLSNHQISVISSESRHFFSRTALMYLYMGHMRYQDIKPYADHFWEKNNIDLLFDHVNSINFSSKELILRNGGSLQYDKLILATGSKPRLLDIEGIDLKGVQGLYSIKDLELMETNTSNIRQAVIAGGGLIGIEMAEMLHSRNIPVHFLVREKLFWNNVLPDSQAEMTSNHIRKQGIHLHHETELSSLNGENKRVREALTNKGEKIACDFAGITIGVEPNIEFLNNSGIDLNKGILVNEYFESNIPDVYAIGDCAEFKNFVPGRKAIEQVWYTGRIMGETLAFSICKERIPYLPGPWFNSAKFFDIEYQVYGDIRNQAAENRFHFEWQDQQKESSVVIEVENESGQVTGISLLGIRARHEIIENWLKKKVTLEYLISHFNEINFNPEFYPNLHKELKRKFKLFKNHEYVS